MIDTPPAPATTTEPISQPESQVAPSEPHSPEGGFLDELLGRLKGRRSSASTSAAADVPGEPPRPNGNSATTAESTTRPAESAAETLEPPALILRTPEDVRRYEQSVKDRGIRENEAAVHAREVRQLEERIRQETDLYTKGQLAAELEALKDGHNPKVSMTQAEIDMQANAYAAEVLGKFDSATIQRQLGKVTAAERTQILEAVKDLDGIEQRNAVIEACYEIREQRARKEERARAAEDIVNNPARWKEVVAGLRDEADTEPDNIQGTAGNRPMTQEIFDANRHDMSWVRAHSAELNAARRAGHITH